MKRSTRLTIAIVVVISFAGGAVYVVRSFQRLNHHFADLYMRLGQANTVCLAIRDYIDSTNAWPKTWADVRPHLKMTDAEAAAAEKEIGIDYSVSLQQVIDDKSEHPAWLHARPLPVPPNPDYVEWVRAAAQAALSRSPQNKPNP